MITTSSQGNFICHRLWGTTAKIYDELEPAKAAALPRFHALQELTLQGPLQIKESYSVGKYSTK